MNKPNPYLKEYKKNQVETATSEEILILLYNGAINYLNKAKIGIQESNLDQFRLNILRCQKIIREFMDTLNMELGGDLAARLYELYRYLHKVLTKSMVTENTEGIEEVLKHLINLRETWLQAIEISKNEKEQEGDISDENYAMSVDVSDTEDVYVQSNNYENSEENDDENEEDEDYESEEEVLGQEEVV